MKLRGMIEHRDLEGGIFQLVEERGARTTLIYPAAKLKPMCGARVEVEGEPEPGGGFGLAMAGPQLRVTSIRKL